MSWNRYGLGQANIFYDETHPLLSSYVLPPHVEEVKRCLTDFSCLVNEKKDSFSKISKDMTEDLEQGQNSDPTCKAAEMIQHEVLSKVGGGYDESVWREIFEKRFFDQLTDSLSASKEDSRRVSRNKYYYDQVIRSNDQTWTLFEPDKMATTTRLRPVKSPKPDQVFFLPIYHHHNNTGLPKVVEPKARQWNHAGDSRVMEPFTWWTLQRLNKVGLEPSPFRTFDKSLLGAYHVSAGLSSQPQVSAANNTFSSQLRHLYQSPVFAGRSPSSQATWPRGRIFEPPKTQKSPMDRSGISPSPPANAKAEECIDLTSDSRGDPSNTNE